MIFKKEKLIDIAIVVAFVGLIILLWNKPKSPLNFTWQEDGDYLLVSLKNGETSPIKLSGLKIELGGEQITIPQGADTFIASQVNKLDDIIIAPEEIAYINIGRSPVGVSFKENVCSGYLAETQNFTPKFSSSCPRQSPPIGCEAEFASIPKCEGPIKIKHSFTPLCLDAVLKLNYNDCLAENLNQKNFLGNWRIYLNQEGDFKFEGGEEVKLVLE